ncbi:MAG: MMPL family transporter, partial [Rhodobacteraceae bacterium]|nr:MMPL family transporter [Paracoccaceae bacterium]
VVCAMLAGLGALGWSGLKLNSTTVSAPLYIMFLAVASSVHIVVAIRQNMHETSDRKEWVRKALTEHMFAIIVTGVSTAIGFFCLNFSVSPPTRQLGNIVGVGVLATTVYTLTLLPSMMILLPVGRRTSMPMVGQAMETLAEFIISRRRVLLPIMAVLVPLMASGMTRLVLEDSLIGYFDDRYEFRRDADFIEERLTGIMNLDFPLRSSEPQGINDPDFLAEISAFTRWLREQPEVGYVNSLTDTIARLNMNLHGDDPSWFRLPDTRTEISDLLFIYELSLGYGMDLTDRIDINRQILRLGVFAPHATSTQMLDLSLRAGIWLKDNAPSLQKAWSERNPHSELITPTGLVHVFNLISYRDTRSMIAGTLLALVLISGIIMLMLRSVRIGLISLIPNLIPAAMSFGLWGYGVGTVTFAIAIVLAATLGIVVDDTVHFLSKYSRARRAGRSSEDSVRYAFHSVGMALVVSTASLVIGFAILAQSGFAVNGDFAKLTAMTIALALIADFLLLPPLLIWLEKTGLRWERPDRGTLAS